VFEDVFVATAWERLEVAAVECAAASASALSDADVIDCLAAVHRAEQAARAAKLRLVRQLDIRRIPSTRHATSVTNWLRGQLRISGSQAGRLVVQARALQQWSGLGDALGAGEVNSEQFGAIVASLGALPDDVGVDVAGDAESMLIRWAGELDPVQLRQAGTRILAHLAPELAEQADAAALARAEKAAHRDRFLTLTPTGDGRVRLRGCLDVEAAAIVTAALDPLCVPGRGTDARRRSAGDAASDPVIDDRSPGQRRADALADVCRLALATGELPVNGGDRPQLVVTVPFDVLNQKVGAGELDTGGLLSPQRVRQLACDARILPAVLGGKGQVLDLGRSRRLAVGPVRRAVTVRDRGCAFPGCDRPARWCDVHHLVSWFDGGRTDLANLVLLCRYHHRLIHCGDWRVRPGPDGHPEFIAPAYIDSRQIPRRNLYHRRT
jgi:uncharacterized protein DUF222/HNH endonuclease